MSATKPVQTAQQNISDELKARQTKRVTDPVHGEIFITPIEQSILDRAEFQRLRHIRQQSIAYYSFPSNHTCRFSHSLGAMHVAGMLFKRAIENADKRTLISFIADSKLLIQSAILKRVGQSATQQDCVDDSAREAVKKYLYQLHAIIGSPLGINHRPSRVTSERVVALNQHDRMVLNAIWQAVRLATLLHDIGHLPTSHLFEAAIAAAIATSNCGSATECFITRASGGLAEQYKRYAKNLLDEPICNHLGNLSGGRDLHEILGVAIDSTLRDHDEWKSNAYDRSLWLAQQILVSPGPEKLLEIWSAHSDDLVNQARVMKNMTGSSRDVAALRLEDTQRAWPAAWRRQRVSSFLHSLVSGEIDADRLDYCLRDPHAAAIDGSSFDVRSILSNVCLVSVSPTPVQKHRPQTTRRYALYATERTACIEERQAKSSVYAQAFHPRAAQAIEGFYFSRFHSFRQIAHDHNSARFYVLYQELIRRLLLIASNVEAGVHDTETDGSKGIAPRARLATLLHSDGWASLLSKGAKGDLKRTNSAFPLLHPRMLVRYDDAWLRTSVTNILRYIDADPQLLADQEIREIRLLCDTCLHRNIGTLVSIFKTEADVHEMARIITSQIVRCSSPMPSRVASAWRDLCALAVQLLLLSPDTVFATDRRMERGVTKSLVDVRDFQAAIKESALKSLGQVVDVGQNGRSGDLSVVVLAHWVHHKLPSKKESRRLPAAMLRLDALGSKGQHKVVDLAEASTLLDALTGWRVPTPLRVTIAASRLRSRDGQVPDIAYEILRSACERVIYKQCVSVLEDYIRDMVMRTVTYSSEVGDGSMPYGQWRYEIVRAFPFLHQVILHDERILAKWSALASEWPRVAGESAADGDIEVHPGS